MFALNQEGKFLYISETVSIYLGLSQVRDPQQAAWTGSVLLLAHACPFSLLASPTQHEKQAGSVVPKVCSLEPPHGTKHGSSLQAEKGYESNRSV